MRARHVFVVVVLSAAALVGAGFVLGHHDDGSPRATPDGTARSPIGHVRWTAVASELGVTGSPRQIGSVGDDLFVVRFDAALWGFEVADGAVRWRRELTTGRIARTLGDADHVPLVSLAEDAVEVTAIDAASGRTRWVADLPEVGRPDVDDTPVSTAVGPAPLISPRVVGTAGGVLVRTTDGTLHGLDRLTGERRWSRDHPGFVVDADRELLLLIDAPPEQVHDPLGQSPQGSEPGVLRVVDQATGEVRWTAALPIGAADTGLMAVIVPSGDIVAADGDGTVRGLTRSTGAPRWERAELRRGPTLALARAADTIVTQDRSRMFVGLDVDSGFVRWRHDWLVPGPTALLTAARRAVVLSADDRLAVLGVDHGTVVWQESLPADTGIATGGDIALIADRRGQLTGFDVTRGAVRWQVRLPLGGRVSLAVDEDGNLYWRSPVRGAVASPDPLDGRQRWMAALSGASAGEPRVVGPRLVMHHATVPDDWQGQRDPGTVISSLDRDSGETVWEVAAEPDEASDDDVPSPVALDVEHDRVVVAVGRRVRALTYERGDERWTTVLEHPVAVGPVRAGDAAVVADRRGELHALGLRDGEVRWSTALDGRVHHLVGRGDRTLLVTTDTGEVVALDGSTGTPTWSVDLGTVASHRPAVVDGSAGGATVVVTVGGTAVGLDAADGYERWRADLAAPLSGAPAVRGTSVVFATTDGTLAALDAADGVVVEQHILRPLGAGPVVGGSMTYVVSVDGEIHALAPDDVGEEWPLPPIGPR